MSFRSVYLTVVLLGASLLVGCGDTEAVSPTADEIKTALNELVDRDESKQTNVWEVTCDDQAATDADGDLIWKCVYMMRSYNHGAAQSAGVFVYVDGVLKEAKKYKRERAEQAGEAQE